MPSASSRIGNASRTSISARDQRVDPAAVEAGDHAGDDADRAPTARSRRSPPRATRGRRRATREKTSRPSGSTPKSGPARARSASRSGSRALGYCAFGGVRRRACTISGAQTATTIIEHDEAERGERDPVLAQPPPEQLQRRTRRDRRVLSLRRSLGPGLEDRLGRRRHRRLRGAAARGGWKSMQPRCP